MATKLSDALTHLDNLNNKVLGLDGASPVSASKTSFDIPQKSKKNSGTIVLPLEAIVVAPDRVRCYFDNEKTESLVQSIQAYGFRGALWVRQVGDAYYLVAGGRRYAACQQLGIEEVPVEILEVSDAEALQLELLENFQREDLNPVEETEGVLKMLEVTLELSRSEVIALLNRKAYEQRGKQKHSATDIDARKLKDGLTATTEDDNLWPIVEEVFRVIGKFNPESFRTHRLPLLKLPNSILKAVQAGELEYSKARIISRVKDEKEQEKLLNRATKQGLTQTEIATAVRQLNGSGAEAEAVLMVKSQERQLQDRAKQISRSLKARFAILTSREQAKVEKLLSQLEELLIEDTTK